MKRIPLFSLIFLTILISACQSQSAQQPLNGSSWSLNQLNGHSLVAGSHIEVQFKLDTFSGFGGCNAYGGQYQIKGENFSITDGITSTAMACLSPEGVGEQEGEYLTALSSVQKYQFSGNRLEMQDARGELRLVYLHQGTETALDLDQIIGSTWQVLTIEGEGLLPDSQITMQFTKPGLVEGFGGCRSYQAEFVETELGPRFTSTSMREEICRQEDLLVQEQDFTDYFTWADHFELVDNTLILYTQRGEEIVFIPLEE